MKKARASRLGTATHTEWGAARAGLETWPRVIYDLVTQISLEYDHPILEIIECGCFYMDTRYEKENGRVRMCAARSS
jgi:beta-glucosidase